MALRVVFFGTPAFAVPSLARLIASGHEVVAVVTQPDRPRGRGRPVVPEAVKRAALEARLPVLQPERLRDPEWLATLASVRPDLGVVAAYGRILPQALLDLPRLGMINVHASLLPRWRGAAPVHRAILAGDERTGVTIMRVVLALDAGPMLARVETPIAPDETSAELESRLSGMGAGLLMETIDRLASGPVAEIAQDETAVTYASRLERRDSAIDWRRPARAVHDQIRGLHPWPLAGAILNGRRVSLLRSEVVDEGRAGSLDPADPADPAAPGRPPLHRHRRLPQRLRRRLRAGRDPRADHPGVGPRGPAGGRVPQRPARADWRPAGAAARAGAMTPVRLAAARVLLQVDAGQLTLASALDRARGGIEDDRDRALLVEVTAGVLRWRAALDAAIGAHSRRALDTLAPEVRAALRLGAYQLRHLARVPAHASVSESVELTRALGHPAAAGFVNAVLRRIAESRDAPVPAVDADAASPLAVQVSHLSTRLSHPAWLVERWLARYGFADTAAWLEFNNRTPEMTVRVSWPIPVEDAVAAIRVAGLEAEPGRYAHRAIRLPAGTLGRLPAGIRESVEIQDEVSQLVGAIVAPAPGHRVLDVCAAPGGKTLVMAERLDGRGLLVAADARPARVRLLRQTVTRAATPVHVVALDGRQPLPFGAVFDRVLLDAPCSGVGTLRRDPDLKWSRRDADIARLAQDQARMIQAAAAVLRPGGMLVYATCSPEPEENDAVVDAFLDTRPDFRLVPPPATDEAPAIASLVDSRDFLRTLPFRDGLDAYVAACLVRHEDA